MKINRVQRIAICRGHQFWDECDKICLQAKNLYNYTNYIMRNEFINNKIVFKYSDLAKMLKTEDVFKEIGSNSGQHVLKMLCKNWKSFLVSIKDYSKNPSKYLGKPRIPKYLNKNGRYVCVLTNWQTQIKDGYLYFAFKRMKDFNNMFKVKFTGKHLSTRIVPKGNSYILEIVYEKEINDSVKVNNHIASIDLGVNNLITLTNNIGLKPIIINGKKLKADNQYYNKTKAKYQSITKTTNKMDWSRRLQRITDKRYWKMEYSLHKISKYIVDYCVEHNITNLVIGLNKTWKQECELYKDNLQQNFIHIPYDNLIHKIQYKCEEHGIKVYITEESYTSATSFLDGEMPIKENYDKSRRVHRGLFISDKGKKINADVNGSLQIMKKVFPNAFANGIEGLDLVPLVINLL